MSTTDPHAAPSAEPMNASPTPDDRDPDAVRTMFAAISDRYDLANHLLSFGLDTLWRHRVTQLVAARRPRAILDLATGSGDLALALHKALPNATIAAADFCVPMLRKAAAKGLQNLVVADGLHLPFADRSFDAATIAFGLRNFADWDAGLRELRRVLRPDGTLVVLDFSKPHPLLLPFYRLYLHLFCPRLAGLITRQPDAYRYLGASIEAFPSGDAMLSRFRAAGFLEPHAHPYALGIVSAYVGTA